MRVIITGASGVLGSAIYKEFKSDGSHQVEGWAHSNPNPDFVRVDLLDAQKTEEAIKAFSPNWIIHCAAERRPDVAQQDPERARQLNAQVPQSLADLSSSLDFSLIYISTDYVFDGTSPPYEVDSPTHPLQFYGETKLAGEKALQTIPTSSPGHRLILRVPVLYGPAPKNSDSAVNILLDTVTSPKPIKMDHIATRYPTCTLDIAGFLVRLSKREGPLPGILHYAAGEPYTKYEMCLVMAGILGVGHGHITPVTEADEENGAGVQRPKDCRLSTKSVEELGMDLGCRGFEEYWREALGKK